MENQTFYVKFLDFEPVLIETHFNGEEERRRPLSLVAHLISAFQNRPGSVLANTDSGCLTLHLPENISKHSVPLEWFSSQDETSLDISCQLSALGEFGTTAKQPLIIKGFLV